MTLRTHRTATHLPRERGSLQWVGLGVAAALAVAAATAVVPGRALLASAAQPRLMDVIVGNAAVGSALEFAMNGAKLQKAVAKDEDTRVALDVAPLGDVEGRIEVDQCRDDRYVVHLLARGVDAPPEDGCDRRPIGGWFPIGRTSAVTVDLSGWTVMTDTASTGMSTNTKLLIGLGGVGAAGLGLALAGGGSDSSSPGPITGVPNSTAGTPPPAPPPTTTAQCGALAGTYSCSATLNQPFTCTTQGTLPVFPSSFTGTMTLTIDNSCGGTARHVYANGWSFAYVVGGSPTSLTTPSPLPHTIFGQYQFQSTISLTCSGSACTSGTEIHNRVSGGPTCTDRYALTCTKQ